MLNIEATFNGEDFEEVQVDSQSWTYSGLKTTLKSQFLLSSDEDIEIYDSENKEFSSASLISWRSKKFRVALLNKRYVPEAYLKGSNNSVSEDTKELESGLTDEISKHKYSCWSKGCRKTFKAPAKLFNHIKIHFKNKPFQWEVKDCGKMFLCKGQLRNHMSTHTEQRRFHCKHPGCDNSYSKKSRLVVHERSHTGERPFVCPYEGCGKSFAEKGNLKTHVRTHTGEKPYFCSVKGCNKRFTTQGHLVDHERRHKDEKPYEWEVCGKAFMRSSTVKVHMKTHGKNLISVPIQESDQLEEAKAIIQEAKKNLPIFVKPIRPIVGESLNIPSVVKAAKSKTESCQDAEAQQRLYDRMEIIRQSYSLIATITSSRGDMFDNACNTITQRPKRRIGIILPSINRINLRESCLLNKPEPTFADKCSAKGVIALNHLNARLMEDDPLS